VGIQTAPYNGGNKSNRPTPTRLISGVVFDTTGPWLAAMVNLSFEVYQVIKDAYPIPAHKVEKLAARSLQHLGGAAGGDLPQLVQANQKGLLRQLCQPGFRLSRDYQKLVRAINF
jgi:hypothetical protein